MPKFEFCLPTAAKIVPAGPDWFHEIKYDGYRLFVARDADRVRLITKGGYDWTRPYPWILEAALKNRVKQFVLDGEAMILGVDGYSDFGALHAGKSNQEVQLCAIRHAGNGWGGSPRPAAIDAQGEPRPPPPRPVG